MINSQKIMYEIKAMGVASLYFAIWIGVFIIIKKLLLAEYQIEFNGLSMVLIGTLILAKVVLILEHVPLGTLVRARPAWVNVVLRTLLYTIVVFIVILLDRSFEGRHEHGGFAPAIVAAFKQTDLSRALANTICVAGALLSYNALSVVRQHLGKGGLLRLFMSPLAEESHN
jgi:drug/metabolite transporter (DMT)-like permease